MNKNGGGYTSITLYCKIFYLKSKVNTASDVEKRNDRNQKRLGWKQTLIQLGVANRAYLFNMVLKIKHKFKSTEVGFQFEH